ncbi:MAG TPA: UDP-N-acetyl-D-mannosamine dehydrogenase [Caldisericia bacterium]|nr:UDP-N-acetyl-D-mannosamine dehydrogenase [Caldisericia bacterium]
MNKPSVVVMGLGYIGLPTGAVIADKGIKVRGVDIQPHVIETINQGRIHIVEPDLASLVQKVVKEGFLQAHTTPAQADIFMIAVPTPFKKNHEPDIAFVEEAAKQITPFLRPGNLILIESTSPVGTTRIIQRQIEISRPELANKLHYAYCPERVLPGKILQELRSNPRIIGGITPEDAQKAKEFYALFVEGELYTTNDHTAEMCKLVENSFRDVNIAFANELSMICNTIDVDVVELIQLANKHPRVNILSPGCGVGGHCIAVDPWFLVHQFPRQAKLIRQARETNDLKPLWVLSQVDAAIASFKQKNHKEPNIACLGLAFKPNIDDLRESPALQIAKKIVQKYPHVVAVEPNVPHPTIDSIPTVPLDEALQNSDIFIVLVAHCDFKNLQIPSTSTVLDFTHQCKAS